MVLLDLKDVVLHCVLQYGARVLHNQLVNQRACDVLHKEVAVVAASQVNVKEQLERAGYEDLALIQLGDQNVQRLAGAGFASIKSDALDCTLGFHGAEIFLGVRWAKVLLLRHDYIRRETFFIGK